MEYSSSQYIIDPGSDEVVYAVWYIGETAHLLSVSTFKHLAQSSDFVLLSNHNVTLTLIMIILISTVVFE